MAGSCCMVVPQGGMCAVGLADGRAALVELDAQPAPPTPQRQHDGPALGVVRRLWVHQERGGSSSSWVTAIALDAGRTVTGGADGTVKVRE